MSDTFNNTFFFFLNRIIAQVKGSRKKGVLLAASPAHRGLWLQALDRKIHPDPPWTTQNKSNYEDLS